MSLRLDSVLMEPARKPMSSTHLFQWDLPWWEPENQQLRLCLISPKGQKSGICLWKLAREPRLPRSREQSKRYRLTAGLGAEVRTPKAWKGCFDLENTAELFDGNAKL